MGRIPSWVSLWRYDSQICLKDPDIAVLSEAMPVPGKYNSGWSQSSIGWNKWPQMEDLEKVPKELKGTAIGKVEQQYELTSTPRARVSSCICSRSSSWSSLGREAPRSCKLYMSQYRGMSGPRSGSRWVGEQGGGGYGGISG